MTSIHPSAFAHLSAEEFADAVLPLNPAVAVFDCDGTLWNGDAGYEFMIWSISEGIVSRNASDWIDSRYRLYRAGEVSEIAMCAEMVQIYDGLRETEVRNAAAAFFQSRIAAKIFPEMHKLVSDLEMGGTDIWAVSSTNNWVVEEGLRSFRIPANRILAARAQVTAGMVTSRMLDVPSDEAKAMSLARAGVLTPDAVFGNSIHDAAMLQIARHPFAVNPTPHLLKIAGQNGWPVFYPHGTSAERA